MRRLATLLVVGGVGLVAGGLVYLFFRDYGMPAPETWRIAVELALRAPSLIVENATNGAKSDFFAGILAALVGAACFLSGLVIASLRIVFASAAGWLGGMKTASAGPKPTAAEDPAAAAATPRPARSTGAGAATGLKARFRSATERRERLEEGRVARIGKVVTAAGKRAVAWVETVIARRREAVRQGRREVPARAVDRVDAKRAASDFSADLDAWYTRAKNDRGGHRDLVLEARELLARTGEAERQKVYDGDAIQGEFKLQIMEAWAGKPDTDGAEKAGPAPGSGDYEASIIGDAIRDVAREGTATTESDSGEEELDLEGDDDFLGSAQRERLMQAIAEAQQDDDAGPGDAAMAAEEIGGSADDPGGRASEGGENATDEGGAEAEDAGPGGGSDGAERLRAEIARVVALEGVAREVFDGIAEWPEDIQEAGDRADYLDRTIMAISAHLAELSPDRIDALVTAEGEEREWQWLARVRPDIDAEYRRLRCEVGVDAETEDGEVEAADSEDEDPEEAGANAAESFREEGILELIEADTRSESGAPAATSEAESGRGEPDGAAAAAKTDATDAAARDDSEAPAPDIAETAAEGAESAPAAVPSSINIGEHEEIEWSGDLLDKWGYEAKSAGASEAKLAHSVMIRDGARRRVVGIVHMLAVWRTESNEGRGRLNLFFRYVPEGDFRLETGGDIRMMDSEGRCVSVGRTLLEHKEVAGNTTVIHFHGPGVREEMTTTAEDGTLVTTRPLGADEIRSAVIG